MFFKVEVIVMFRKTCLNVFAELERGDFFAHRNIIGLKNTVLECEIISLPLGVEYDDIGTIMERGMFVCVVELKSTTRFNFHVLW